MFALTDYYEMVEKDRALYFKLFKLVDKEVFHKTYEKDTWSLELIFRHLLSTLNWFKNLIPNVDFEDTELGFKYGTLPNDTVSLEDLEKEFERISTAVREGIEKMTPEEQEEELDSGFGPRPRSKAIAGLIHHESQHLGQATWIFKRISGWTDQDIREKLYGIQPQ